MTETKRKKLALMNAKDDLLDLIYVELVYPNVEQMQYRELARLMGCTQREAVEKMDAATIEEVRGWIAKFEEDGGELFAA